MHVEDTYPFCALQKLRLFHNLSQPVAFRFELEKFGEYRLWVGQLAADSVKKKSHKVISVWEEIRQIIWNYLEEGNNERSEPSRLLDGLEKTWVLSCGNWRTEWMVSRKKLFHRCGIKPQIQFLVSLVHISRQNWCLLGRGDKSRKETITFEGRAIHFQGAGVTVVKSETTSAAVVVIPPRTVIDPSFLLLENWP